MSQPLVSIVTPSFNQAAFIEDTILSVLNQTYSNIEYIIIDGGSTDGSAEIIEKYEKRLKYRISEKDKGQAHALNKGFERADGQIFAYLNSDDMLEKNAVEKIVKAFARHPEQAMIYGRCTYVDEKGKFLSGPHGAPIDYKELLTWLMAPKMNQPTCFFNRDFLNRKPLFREDLKFGMDYELILRLMKTGKPVLFLDEKIAFFRFHPGSKTVSREIPMVREQMKIQREYGPEYKWLWVIRFIKHWVKVILVDYPVALLKLAKKKIK